MDYREKLRKISEASTLSQQVLAGQLGTSFVSLNNWLNGKTEPTREDFRQAIDLQYDYYVGKDEVDLHELIYLKEQALKQRISAKALLADADLLQRLVCQTAYHIGLSTENPLDYRALEQVLYRQVELRGYTRLQQTEAINYKVALEMLLKDLADNGHFQLTPDLVRRIHLLLTNGISSQSGEYRRQTGRIRGLEVPPSSSADIPDEIERLCNDINSETRDPIAMLARTHASFQLTRPFADGNGRVGRLIMSVKALDIGIFPPIIPRSRRTVYDRYLNLAQSADIYDPFEQLVSESVIEGYRSVVG